MTKTLADMAAEERAQCRGMWCDFPDPDERTNLAIYVGDSIKHQGLCELIHEGQLGTLTIPETLTPRYDLRPAWTAKGEPFPLPALTKRSRDRKPINASEVQGILGTDWLEGKTPEELVREHREGME